MTDRATERPLPDTITEHDSKEPANPRATGDPSSPQGPFWHPEDATRDEDFHNMPVPELEEKTDKSR